MEIRENNIIFLLGAGCSKSAGIPISTEMVQKVEELLMTSNEWGKYTNLYNYLRSSIEYSEGIFGNFDNTFNIERLLITMNEIEKRDKNIIYPFIGSWNLRLSDVAGQNFEKITELKQLIKEKLIDWTNPKDLTKKVNYYKGFEKFHSEIGYSPIRVFSLNYDLCFEKAVENDEVEQGFDTKTYEWQYSNFENFENSRKSFCLYKLHGSINWYTDKHTGRLMLSNHPVINPELIFGIDTKLKSTDPYFFYTSEFRKWLLHKDCKLIVTIGYSFADDYINDLISQSIINDNQKQLLVIIPEEDIERRKKIISEQLSFALDYNQHCRERIKIYNSTAEKFLSDEMTANFFVEKGYISNDNDIPFR